MESEFLDEIFQVERSDKKFSLIYALLAFIAVFLTLDNGFFSTELVFWKLQTTFKQLTILFLSLVAFSGYLKSLSYLNKDYTIDLTPADYFYSLIGGLSHILYHLTLHLPIAVSIVYIGNKTHHYISYAGLTLFIIFLGFEMKVKLTRIIDSYELREYLSGLLDDEKDSENDEEGSGDNQISQSHRQEYDDYEISILAKLWHNNAIGKSYVSNKRVMSVFPSEERIKVKKRIGKLSDEGILSVRNSNLVSINPQEIDRIRDILRGEVPDYVLDLYDGSGE